MNNFLSKNRYLKIFFLYLVFSFSLWVLLDFAYIFGGQNPNGWAAQLDFVLPTLILIGFFVFNWKYFNRESFIWRTFNSVMATALFSVIIFILVVAVGVQIHIALGGRL